MKRKESKPTTMKNHFTKTATKKGTRGLQNRPKTINKVATVSPDISIMILNANVLNFPIKTTEGLNGLKEQDPTTHFRFHNTHRLKVKRWSQRRHANSNQKRAKLGKRDVNSKPTQTT